MGIVKTLLVHTNVINLFKPMFLFGFQKVIILLYAVVTIMLPKKIYEIDFVRPTDYIVI